MFVRVSTLILAIAASVIAVPDDTSSQCDNGSIQCCNDTHDPSAYGMSWSYGLIATGCQIVSVASECAQQAVCCEDDQFNGLVNIGCNAINV